MTNILLWSAPKKGFRWILEYMMKKHTYYIIMMEYKVVLTIILTFGVLVMKA